MASSAPRTHRPSRGERRDPSLPAVIGVGVDGSPASRDAVVLASMLAQAAGAELILIAVYEEPLLVPLVPSEMGWTESPRQARAMLARTRDALAPHARVVVESGTLVWRALRDVTHRQHCDLLVVGSARPAQAGEIGLGDLAGDLLYHLDRPLAIAPRDLRELAEPRLRRIGVGFDDTPEARTALGLAAALARGGHAELELLGVVDDRHSRGLAAVPALLTDDTTTLETAETLYDRAHRAAETTGVQTQITIAGGVAADALRALGNRVDLMVIGSGHSGPRGRVYLGGTASRFVGGAPCPVLIAPRPTDDPAL
jgi:nucleotide-binding universal stress UspA family protein